MCYFFETRCKSLVRSHLEYANSLWNPYTKQDIKALEKVQMTATRLVTYEPYQERLRTLVDLPTMKFRRLRGDMIETYEVLSGIYDTSVLPEIVCYNATPTRGNSLKIANRRCHYTTLRNYKCMEQAQPIPFSVVSAPSVNSFKID